MMRKFAYSVLTAAAASTFVSLQGAALAQGGQLFCQTASGLKVPAVQGKACQGQLVDEAGKPVGLI